jgi:hypothetical protein
MAIVLSAYTGWRLLYLLSMSTLHGEDVVIHVVSNIIDCWASWAYFLCFTDCEPLLGSDSFSRVVSGLLSSTFYFCPLPQKQNIHFQQLPQND